MKWDITLKYRFFMVILLLLSRELELFIFAPFMEWMISF